MKATYSPEDNKLRLYPETRLSRELYDRVKAAGFSWAPKQELFVAPMWTPERADLLTELCEDGIEDEDTSLVDRAEQRAERFEEYSESRKEDAERARAAVSAIADNIPLGQPILVGHHSERHARKDAQRIESGMRRAVKMWDTSQYWVSRAKGAVRAAKYKELPQVRARRIKGLEADKRKQERNKANAELASRFWRGELKHKGDPFQITEENRQKIKHIVGNTEHFSTPIAPGKYGYWSAYDVLRPDEDRYSECPAMTVAEVQEKALAHLARNIERAERWIAHVSNRLAYETAMLEDAGATELLAKKPKSAAAQLPLLNYRAPLIKCPNRYHPGEFITYNQVEMTSAEYAAINKDYKGTNVCENSHRIRTAMQRNTLVAVFLADSKVHEKPEPVAPKPPESPRLAPTAPRRIPCSAFTPLVNGGDYRGTLCCICGEKESAHNTKADKEAFDAIRESLRSGGVQIITAPQLFPTPSELAARVVQLADIQPGLRVLEPSAGTGALAAEVARNTQGTLLCVEINRQLCDGLTRQGYVAECADFLTCNGDLGMFDRIVMNPPFANGADIKHIKHALGFLNPGGRLVAICANGPRQREQLQLEASEWHDLPAGTFSEQGTGVNTALCVFDA